MQAIEPFFPTEIEEIPTDALVEGWLHEKFTRTQSTKTVQAYRNHLTSFRKFCSERGLDQMSRRNPNLPHRLTMALQDWSALGKNGELLSPASINARIAAISSFMEYCQRNGQFDTNPATLVLRKPVQAYRGATAMTSQDVMKRLAEIDTSTLAGKRDYAILAVALVTGKRLSEVASLRMSDIHVGEEVRVVWRRTKGGKSAADILPKKVGWKLLEYIDALRDASPGAPPEHLWVALARNQYNMTPLGIKGLELVTRRHVGTSKFHTLRHTFAHAMQEDGADVSEIQRRLMHSSLQTTGVYLQALRSDENKHGDSLAQMFGIGEDIA